jgi:hypothetical protein
VIAGLCPVAAGCGGGGDSGAGATTSPSRARVSAPQFGRNVARVPGYSSVDVAAGAALAAYPPGGARRPDGFVLFRRDRWRDAALAATLAAAPINAIVLPIERDYVPTPTADVLARVHAKGFPGTHGLTAVVLGTASRAVFSDLRDAGVKSSHIEAASPAQLAAALVPFRAGWAHKTSSSVVVVSSQARDYALPAAAWSAFSGDTLTFVSKRDVPAATAKLLRQRRKLTLDPPAIYVVGPPKVISKRVTDKLGRYGPVRRIAASSAVENAIALAQYSDRATGFGWGLQHGPANVSLAVPARWGDAVAAFAFAASGPRAPLLWTPAGDSLATPVVDYLLDLRGPVANQGYVFGDARALGSTPLRDFDRLLGPAPH